MTGLDVKSIEKCMGDPDADSDNRVLKEEQDAQVLSFIYAVYCLYGVLIRNLWLTSYLLRLKELESVYALVMLNKVMCAYLMGTLCVGREGIKRRCDHIAYSCCQ